VKWFLLSWTPTDEFYENNKGDNEIEKIDREWEREREREREIRSR
jgi:hypothetical protein